MHDRTTGPRTGPHPMAARELSAALAERAEPFCRHYLPHGRRQGRYWFAGDIHGAPGRSLWMCVPAAREQPLGRPGRGGVVVPGDEQPGDAGGRDEGGEAGGGEGGGHRQLGAGGAQGEGGLNPLGDGEHGVAFPKMDCASRGWPRAPCGGR